jgi:hypothetical protein
VAGRLVAVKPDGAADTVLTLPPGTGRAHLAPIAVSSAGSRVLVTSSAPPFQVLEFDVGANGSVKRIPRSRFRNPRLSTTAESDGPLWTSLGLYPLDKGFARSYSDIRGRRRIFATYGADHQLLRATEIDTPMGIMATEPSLRFMVAGRRTDTFELVLYQWRWAGNHLK